MKFFSKTTGGFYDPDIHSVMPKDVVQISDSQHAELLEAQANGQRIAADTSGKPIAVDRPPPTTEQIWDYVRSKRGALLAQSDWTQIPDAPVSDEVRAAWRTYRQALRDVTSQTDPLNLTWPISP